MTTPRIILARDYLIQFLKALERLVPPDGEDAHHAITYVRYGSDEEGWEDRLALRPAIKLPGQREAVFYIDAGDFSKPPAVLARLCAVMVADVRESVRKAHRQERDEDLSFRELQA